MSSPTVVIFQPLKCFGNEHGEIGFPARARERRRYIMFATFRRFDAQNQHVFGEPALLPREVRADSQCEALLTQQNVPAISRADRNNRVVLWKMADETPLRIDI